MYKKRKHIAFLLILLFTSIIAERSIPHTHIEKQGIVLPDFFGNKQSDDLDEHDSEQLHANFYFPEINANLSVELLQSDNIIFVIGKESVPKQIKVNSYNILPKIHNSILTALMLFSPNAPPFTI